jgi:hypothetical protein
VDPHRISEERSLAYHRAIAARLDGEPALISRAIERLERWKRTTVAGRTYLDRWLALLRGPRHELLQVMLGDDEHARTMRSIGPFAGEMTAKERWKLWREVRRRLETTA